MAKSKPQWPYRPPKNLHVIHGEQRAVDGKLERRAVSLGRGMAGDVEVVAGVNAGDELVVSGAENLRDSALAEALQSICDLDLSELQAIIPPRGFGRE